MPDIPILQAAPQPAPATAQDELNAALQRFARVNQTLPNPGQIQLPIIELTAAVDALVQNLIASGHVGEQAFVEAKCRRMTELIDQITEQARAQAAQQAAALIASGQHKAHGNVI